MLNTLNNKSGSEIPMQSGKKKITLAALAFLFCFKTVLAQMTVTVTASNNGPVCQYETVTFTATISGCPPVFTTAWKDNGIPVMTTTGNSNISTFVYALTSPGVHCITCDVTSTSVSCIPNTTTSNTICITVIQNEPPSVSIVESANPVCVGALVVFTATPVDAGNPSYTWYVDNILDASSVTSNLNYTSPAPGTHSIFCIAHSSQACDAMPPVNNPDATSNIIIEQVNICDYLMPTTGNPTNIFTCGGLFMDSGWQPSNYSNNENGAISFCPAVPGQFSSVTFTSFAVQLPDVLTIYSGDNSSGLTLIGNYYSSNPPPSGAITSFTSNGCLTFSFISNGSVTDSGWVANLSCSPVTSVNESENNSGVKIYPNPSNGAINILWENQSNTLSEIFISDCLGKTVASFKSEKNYLLIDEPLSKGVYVVSIVSGNKTFRSPVVIY